MKTQLFTFLSFVLCFAALGEVKVQKAPLKSLLIDNASVVTDVTGTETAKRLEAEGGRSWIDGDGRVYRVERRASFRGLSAVSGDDPAAGTVQWSFDYPGAEYCGLSYDSPSSWRLSYGRMEDVENDGVIWQEEVQYVYEGSAPWGATSVTMKRVDYSEEIVLALAFATNVADRVATTGEVAQIASSISSGLTTNDVCAIVTNEVDVGFTDWEFIQKFEDVPVRNCHLEFYPGGPVWMLDVTYTLWGEEHYTVDYVYNKGEDATELNFDYVIARRRRNMKNELGLAMAKDVVSAKAVTNIARNIVAGEVPSIVPPIARNIVAGEVPSIVTNEVVVGFTDWEFIQRPNPSFTIKDCSLTFYPSDLAWELKATFVADYGEEIRFSEKDYKDADAVELSFDLVIARRQRIIKNELGLAMAKDVVSAKAVTNIARDVSNSFWDEKNSVLWRLDFRDGEPMFVPTTNENVKTTGGML